MNTANLLALTANFSRLLVESQTVVTLRLMGIAGIVPARHDENARMLSEKLPALIKSAVAAQQAALKGHRPDQVMTAAIKPLSRKVRANRKRLMK